MSPDSKPRPGQSYLGLAEAIAEGGFAHSSLLRIHEQQDETDLAQHHKFVHMPVVREQQYQRLGIVQLCASEEQSRQKLYHMLCANEQQGRQSGHLQDKHLCQAVCFCAS